MRRSRTRGGRSSRCHDCNTTTGGVPVASAYPLLSVRSKAGQHQLGARRIYGTARRDVRNRDVSHCDAVGDRSAGGGRHGGRRTQAGQRGAGCGCLPEDCVARRGRLSKHWSRQPPETYLHLLAAGAGAICLRPGISCILKSTKAGPSASPWQK